MMRLTLPLVLMLAAALAGCSAFRQRIEAASTADAAEPAPYLERAAAMLEDGEIAAHLGEVLWARGRKEEAKRVWNEALKFAPGHKVLQQTVERFNP